MAEQRSTRDIPRLTLRATVEPSSIDTEKRTVDVVWTTGSRVLRGFYAPYWEELSLDPKHVRMDRLQNGAPLLAAHDSSSLSSVLGVVEKARLLKEKGTATVRFARAEDDPEADAIFRKVRDGIIKNISVGYQIHKMEKVEQEQGKAPVYRAVDWEPHELSLVPVGADAGAQVRAQGELPLFPCEFVDGEEPKETRAMPEKTETPPVEQPKDNVVDLAKVREEAATAERTRSTEIRRVSKALGLPEQFAEDHVGRGTAVDAFRAAAIDERAKAPPVVPVGGGAIEPVKGGDAAEKWQRGAQAWLLQKASVADLVAAGAKKRGVEKPELDPGEFRGLSMLDLARQSLERAGIRTAGMSKIDLIGKALTRGGMNTTSDFAVLLENTLHKTLLAGYAMAPDTWTQFCATGAVSDFRPHKRYRLGSFGVLQALTEAGEIQNQQIPDGEKESITAATKGSIVAISREAIVNDDMAAFSRIATQIGRAARLTIESDVYALLAENGGLGPDMSDGNPLFDNAHANIGTASAISVAGLDADRVVMASQTDPSGNEILQLRPAILLVPIGLGGTARVINSAQYDPDTASKLQRPNMVQGLFSTIVDTPRLTGTRRYLFAAPADAPTIEVAFLDGQQEPYLETRNGFRVDGVEWKVRLDYAVGAVDFRGAETNAGTT